MSYDSDAALEMRFAKTIKAILGMQFFTKQEFSDLHEATDFAIFSSDPIRCAVRLRRHQYYERYPNDITVRWSRPRGTKTEIHKIRDGLVNHMFYGFVTDCEQRLQAYAIIKLPHPFALEPRSIRQNNPPDSELAIFDRGEFEIVKEWVKL